MTAGEAWIQHGPTDADGMPLSPRSARKVCPEHEGFDLLPGNDEFHAVAAVAAKSDVPDADEVERLLEDVSHDWHGQHVCRCRACGGLWKWRWDGRRMVLFDWPGRWYGGKTLCGSCQRLAAAFVTLNTKDQPVNDDFFFDTAGVALDEPAPAAAAPVERINPVATVAAVSANGRGQQPLYFDLETVPDYSRLHTFGLEPVPEVPQEVDARKLPLPESIVIGTVDALKSHLFKNVCPPGWLDAVAAAENAGKNRAGVHDAIKAARNARQDAIAAHEERRKLLSTTPEFCKVVAVGFAIGNGDPMSIVASNKNPEADLLAFLWQAILNHSPLIGFNCLHFDLPVLFVRSAILGVPSSRMLDLKPWGKDVVDPYLLRFGGRGNTDKQRPGKLKALAACYGIEVPAGDCDGSQVEELLKSDPAKLAEYVRSDVTVLRAFHRSLSGYFWS